jgi:hypothetical protein
MTRGQVCLLHMMLALASLVCLWPESLGTRDHNLLSRFETSLFVASYDTQGHGGGIRPRFHMGIPSYLPQILITEPRGRPHRKHRFQQ